MVQGFRMRTDASSEIIVQHEGGQLEIFETRQNRTLVNPGQDPGLAFVEPATQTLQRFELDPGELRLRTSGTDHLQGKPAAEAGSGVTATLSGPQWESGPLLDAHPYGPDYPEQVDDIVVFFDQGLMGWARSIRTPGERTSLGGDLELRMDGVDITSPELQTHLPPYLQYANPLELPPLARKDVLLFTHAVVELRAARTVIDTSVMDVLCGGLAWGGWGTVTLRNAHGRVSRDQEALWFEERELTLSGAVRFVEEPEERREGAVVQGWIRGQGAGEFEAVGLDFRPAAASTGGGPAGAARAGLFAVVLATVGALASQSGRFVGFFFTRFSPATAPRHPSRALILDLVRARPGIRLRDVASEACINYSVARHHVHVLLAVGLLKAVRGRRGPFLYDRAESVASRPDIVSRHDPLVGHVLRLVPVAGAPLGATLRRVAAEAGVSRVGAWKAVVRAERLGLLRRARNGFRTRVEWASTLPAGAAGPLGGPGRVAVEEGL